MTTSRGMVADTQDAGSVSKSSSFGGLCSSKRRLGGRAVALTQDDF